jgi:hypothetical protein
MLLLAACAARSSEVVRVPREPVAPAPRATAKPVEPTPAPEAEPTAPEPPRASDDPRDLHKETQEDLLALFSLRPMEDKERERTLAGLRLVIGTGSPARMNQGNKAIAEHLVSKRACLRGLEGIVIQTPEQRATCGAENMVPIPGKPGRPAYCIDVFEFPNQACELPFVWSSPSQAAAVCAAQGKRLCTQEEWSYACRGDPEGGRDRTYAYGDKLDLTICHTNKKHRTRCNPTGAQTAWATCATDTEPSGSFPKCRSRFGVFDQHGNVAEIMSREEKGQVLTQLKGSAWFYVEVARDFDQQPRLETHLDHCNFDPRWHVEPLKSAIHVNYHLGFRCCKGL